MSFSIIIVRKRIEQLLVWNTDVVTWQESKRCDACVLEEVMDGRKSPSPTPARGVTCWAC